ncbi:hypothetical protein GC102_09630 [Paenibacillus sp. LMG 31460]|uniref:Uncharacterized protein n=1 Tax=Paenibacillus germinis TaxID=2654979 RepID=A0ABX1Z0U4_9BACL|nr:hypothetical protein [Paenibacillus germinis]NOU86034.1 hypothetical protein [Paenibacillus germinis]
MNLYFRDNFFNSGITEILDEQEENVGHLDLKSPFGSAIEVYGQNGQLLCKGSFPIFSSKWEITGADGGQLGVLRSRIAFFTKKFTYETEGRGNYEIISPVFSKEYEISDESGAHVARFEQRDDLMDLRSTISEYEQFCKWTNILHQLSDKDWHSPIKEGKVSIVGIIAHLRNWDLHSIRKFGYFERSTPSRILKRQIETDRYIKEHEIRGITVRSNSKRCVKLS